MNTNKVYIAKEIRAMNHLSVKENTITQVNLLILNDNAPSNYYKGSLKWNELGQFSLSIELIEIYFFMHPWKHTTEKRHLTIWTFLCTHTHKDIAKPDFFLDCQIG